MAERHEIVILGAGPAGLQAAIHAVRKKADVLVMGHAPRSSILKAHVENYLCTSTAAHGEDMLTAGRKQAENFGAAFLEEDVLETGQADGWFLLKSESGREIMTRALVLAMGISRNKLGVPGEKELLGKGVSYCVDCDGALHRGKKVAVAGSQSAAVSGALTMLFFASEVHLIARSLDVVSETAGKIGDSAVTLHLGRSIKKILGEAEVTGVELDDGSVLEVDGVFIELGAKGAIQLAANLGVNLDPENFQFIVTDKKQHTNLPGVFAAGDITGQPWQVAKAVGEGCVAGLEAVAYVKQFR